MAIEIGPYISSMLGCCDKMGYFKSQWPRIEQIQGFFSPEEAALLYAASTAARLRNWLPALEVGSFHGKSANVLGLVFQTVILVEPSYLWYDPTQRHGSWDGTSGRGFAYTDCKVDLDSREALIKNTSHFSCILLPVPAKEAHLGNTQLSLVFIDGNHTEGGVDIDAEKFLPLLVTGGVAAFHDYGTDYPMVTQVVDGLVARGWKWTAKDGSLVILEKPQ